MPPAYTSCSQPSKVCPQSARGKPLPSCAAAGPCCMHFDCMHPLPLKLRRASAQAPQSGRTRLLLRISTVRWVKLPGAASWVRFCFQFLLGIQCGVWFLPIQLLGRWYCNFGTTVFYLQYTALLLQLRCTGHELSAILLPFCCKDVALRGCCLSSFI